MHKPNERILFVLIGDFFARNKSVHVFPRVIRTPPKVNSTLHSPIYFKFPFLIPIYPNQQQPRTIYPFDPLSEVLSRYPELMQHSHVLLVPGPSDPATITASFALPRDPLPAIMLPPGLYGAHGSKDDSMDEDSEVDEETQRGGRSKTDTTAVPEVIRGSNPCRYASSFL